MSIPGEITVIIRVMPEGNEFDADVPLTSTGTEIIESILEADVVPTLGSDGRPIEYELISIRTDRTIANETLQFYAVTNGEVLCLKAKPKAPPITTSPSMTSPMMGATSGDVSVVIRIMPKGDEFDADLPLSTSGLEIIQRILEEEIAPRLNPEGDPYEYEVVSKRTNMSIDARTLGECSIASGDTLYIVPKMVAGSANLNTCGHGK